MKYTRTAWLQAKETCQATMMQAIANRQDEKVRVLLEAGVNPNFRNSDCYVEETPLHMAVRCESTGIVKLLLEHKADVNAVDIHGCTALHDHTNPNVIRLLIQYGADPNNASHEGLTPLHRICGEGDVAAAEELKGADPNAYFKDMTPLHYACSKGNWDMIKWLVKHADANPRPVTSTPLFSCADHSLSPKALMDLGMDPLHRDEHGNTALHCEISSDRTEGEETSDEMKGELRLRFMNELLINAPSLVEAQNHEQETALHLAVQFGDKSMIRFLVDQHKADLMAKDRFGRIPSFRAVFYDADNLEDILDLMDENNIDINVQDYNGWTMLHWSVFLEHPKDALMLLDRGANRNARNFRGRLPLHMVGFPHDDVRNALTYSDYDISAALNNVGRVLDTTTEELDLKLLQELLSRDVNVLARDKDGNLPFFLAASSGCLTQMFMMLKVAVGQGFLRKKSGKVNCTAKRSHGKAKSEESPAKKSRSKEIGKCQMVQEISHESVGDVNNEAILNAKIDAPGLELGVRLAVYWSDDDAYYFGTVIQFDGQGRFEVEYDDGKEKEWLNQEAHIVAPATAVEAIQEKKRAIARIKKGDRISVWWPLEHMYYSGKVTCADHSMDHPFFIVYDDGDKEWLNLITRKYNYIGT